MCQPDPLEQAEGYVALGMFSDAWEVIEDLPPEEKTSEPVLVIRIRILTGLFQWELGEEMARLLLSGGERSRKTVARFHHARPVLSGSRETTTAFANNSVSLSMHGETFGKISVMRI